MRILAVASICLAATITVASAADYPDHSIRLIVPQAPGSATDNAARLLGAVLSQELGQQIIVDNRPGGALTIGLDLVAKSPPDGYTIGMGPIGALAITRHMVSKLPYDIERDFQPIALVTRGQMLLAVSPRLPVNSVKELIDYAKQNPGKLTNASSSNGSPGHVGAELFKYMTGTKIVHVPYRGSAPLVTDLLGGQVQCAFDNLPGSIEQLRAGKLRALAVSTATRSESLPDIPTVGEFLPTFDAKAWVAIGVPKNTPVQIIETLNAEINAGLANSTLKARVTELGATVFHGSPADFNKLVADDTEKWAKVIRATNIKPE